MLLAHLKSFLLLQSCLRGSLTSPSTFSASGSGADAEIIPELASHMLRSVLDKVNWLRSSHLGHDFKNSSIQLNNQIGTTQDKYSIYDLHITRNAAKDYHLEIQRRLENLERQVRHTLLRNLKRFHRGEELDMAANC